MFQRIYTVFIVCLLSSIVFVYFFTQIQTASGESISDSNPFLVKDIVPGSEGAAPAQLLNVAGKIFFSTGPSFGSDELWVSDGTMTGTVQLADNVAPSNFGNYSATLFASGNGSGNNYDGLWKSNGSVTGTMLVKTFDNSTPVFFTEAADTLFFNVAFGGSGRELYKTDGSELGTVLVKDINISGESDPHYLTEYNDILYFTAYTENGRELWISDGSFTGTNQFMDINEAGSSYPANLTVLNDKLFFSAEDGFNGKELWVTDGIPTNTMIISNINPVGSSNPSNFNVVEDKLFFTANDGEHGEELWVVDETGNNLLLVKDITLGGNSTNFFWLVAASDRLFFVVEDEVIGRELWVSDGTENGTHLIKDINPSGHAFTDFQSMMLGFRNKVYFFATDGTNGVELWESDGSVDGTIMVKDLNPDGDAIGTFLASMAVREDTLYFSATDGQTGYELWGFHILAEVSFSSSEYIVVESSESNVVTITLDAPLNGTTVSVDYVLRDGTAMSGTDYLSDTGTLTIPAGQKLITLTIPVLDDIEKEQNETLFIDLVNPVSGIVITPQTATLTILDNDYAVYLPIIENLVLFH